MGLRYGEDWLDCSSVHFETVGNRLRGEFGISPDRDLFARIRVLSLSSALDNLSGIAGTWLFAELLKQASQNVDGNIAEMGVYKGSNALTALLLLGSQIGRRRYHLFDSFAGLAGPSVHDPSDCAGEFDDVSLPQIQDLFTNFEQARIHVGLFSETLHEVASECFALVYVDCDLYEPTLECCEFFYDRLSPHGTLLFHDYCEAFPNLPQAIKQPFAGVKKAVDEFFAARPEKVIEFPETSHALVVKR